MEIAHHLPPTWLNIKNKCDLVCLFQKFVIFETLFSYGGLTRRKKTVCRALD